MMEGAARWRFTEGQAKRLAGKRLLELQFLERRPECVADKRTSYLQLDRRTGVAPDHVASMIKPVGSFALIDELLVVGYLLPPLEMANLRVKPVTFSNDP